VPNAHAQDAAAKRSTAYTVGAPSRGVGIFSTLSQRHTLLKESASALRPDHSTRTLADMDIVLGCLLALGLQIAAIGSQSPSYYRCLRFIMPVLAIVMVSDAVGRDVATHWPVAFALSGLFIVPGDAWPRLVWLPINLATVGLYLGYLSLIMRAALT
jgi:hypothetical protein